MTMEEFAWNMIKKGLNLGDKEIEDLRNGILSLKEVAPELKRRAEKTEVRILALCIYFQQTDKQRWEKAEQEALKRIEEAQAKGKQQF